MVFYRITEDAGGVLTVVSGTSTSDPPIKTWLTCEDHLRLASYLDMQNKTSLVGGILLPEDLKIMGIKLGSNSNVQ